MGFLDDKSEIPMEELIKVVDPKQIENLIEKRKDQVWNGAILYTFYYTVTSIYLQLNYTYKPLIIAFYWFYMMAMIASLVLHKLKAKKYSIYIFQQLTICRISVGLLEHNNRKN